MNWITLLLGMLAMAIGLEARLSPWGVPSRVAHFFSTLPTFGLPSWVFVVLGIILLYLSFRQ